MGRRFQDLTGQKFNRLTVIKRAENIGTKTVWLCKCECGNTKLVPAGDLKLGKIKSCGCLRRELSTNQVEDLTGQKFGRLTVLRLAEPSIFKGGKRKINWKCLCDCGNIVNVRASYLKDGRTTSCGCYNRERTIATNTTHNASNSRLFRVWATMLQRCSNSNCASYKNYGGRGITVCDDWKNSFQIFQKWALENGYNENAKRGDCTIDRIDVDGDYCPENCRWVNMIEQAHNKRKKQ